MPNTGDVNEACGGLWEDAEYWGSVIHEADDLLREARRVYEDAKSDDAWNANLEDIAGAGAILASCIAPVTWVVCAFGIAGGGAAIVHGERNRGTSSNIAAARDRVEAAEALLERALAAYEFAYSVWHLCAVHHSGVR